MVNCFFVDDALVLSRTIHIRIICRSFAPGAEFSVRKITSLPNLHSLADAQFVAASRN
jgi:hypothetical protein